jgi:TrmH family RNA methyltransferase
MMSKNRIKFITSLQKKKVRDEKRLFVIEGDKLVREYLMSGTKLHLLAAKPEFIASLKADEKAHIDEIIPVSFDELKKISTLKTPHNAAAVIPMSEKRNGIDELLSGLCVALDFIQDPGNLGTIIRTAAWFGIKNIICSEDSVDNFNPKVIQASMGAFLHVDVNYLNLKEFLVSARKKGVAIYGTVMNGESVYNKSLGKNGIIVFGNESRGISEEILEIITDHISIPRFNDFTFGIDSLNVGMAATVIFSEFARRRI